MSKKSKSPPIIGLRAVYGDVQRNPSGTGTFLDVKFKCDFAPNEKGLYGSAVSLRRKDMFSVVQLAESFHGTICKLLAEQRKAEPSSK